MSLSHHKFLIRVIPALVAFATLMVSGTRSAARPHSAPVRLTAPACTTATAAAPPISAALRTTIVAGYPNDATALPGGRWVFAAVNGIPPNRNSRLDVFAENSGELTFMHAVSLGHDPVYSVAVSSNRRFVFVAGYAGTTVLSSLRIETGRGDPILGRIRVPGPGSQETAEAITSPSSRYLLLSVSSRREVAVYNLAHAALRHFGTAGYIGAIPFPKLRGIDEGPMSFAVTPDGRWLLVSAQAAPVRAQGTLSLISLRRAQSDPAHALRATVTAGCTTTRLVISPDGKTAWVAATGSNALLGYSITALATDPRRALVADIRVGTAPIGMSFVNAGHQLVIADAGNRQRHAASGALSIVDPVAALERQPALLGTIPTAADPTELSETDDGTLLIAEPRARQIQTLPTTALRPGYS